MFRFYTMITDTQRFLFSDQPSESEDSWSEWSLWGACSVECGGGVQVKTRNCEGPIETCDGPNKLTRPCNTNKCKGILIVIICLAISDRNPTFGYRYN